MYWSEEETIRAVEQALRLSELLQQENFLDQRAIIWLREQDIDNFLVTINEAEVEQLEQIATNWNYEGHGRDPNGFHLLDCIWISGTAFRQQKSLDSTSKAGAGRKLVARIARYKPMWVFSWWSSRIKDGKRIKPDLESLDDIVIDSLTKSDFVNHLMEFSDEIVVSILYIKPDFIELLPNERCHQILPQVIIDEYDERNITSSLFECGVPSNITPIIDNILDSKSNFEAIFLLNRLVQLLIYRPDNDPVATVIKQRYERLVEFFQFVWAIPKVDYKNHWNYSTSHAGHMFSSLVQLVPDCFKPELGFIIGLQLAENKEEATIERIIKRLNYIGIHYDENIVHALLPTVELWATLRNLAKYNDSAWNHKTELIGLSAKVVALATSSPEVWAQSLPYILDRSSNLGQVPYAITLELAINNPDVQSALEAACNNESESIRLKAQGLWALLNGLEDPEAGLPATLADAAAHFMDGTPIFPHPLAPMSATWLGSAGIEQAIINGVRRAVNRFAVEVCEQGGDIEEALTKALVKEIEAEFRQIKLQIKLLGSSNTKAHLPVLSISQRPTSKQKEEPVYGCDLAWILNATVRDRYSGTWVELVQVKKSKALIQSSITSKPRADSWKIESKQLNDILKWSATAVYWLIASQGEVLTVPAKHLNAIKNGTGVSAHSKSFTVRYTEVRSVAIPLEQYLVNLLIGQWVGTSSEEVIEFARDGNLNIRPRVAIEVTISINNHDQKTDS